MAIYAPIVPILGDEAFQFRIFASAKVIVVDLWLYVPADRRVPLTQSGRDSVEPFSGCADLVWKERRAGAGSMDSTTMQNLGTGLSRDDPALLLPWHVSGRLSRRQSRRIDVALHRDKALARDVASMRRERDAVIGDHEMLGRPSPQALVVLFAAIDADIMTAQKFPRDH